MLALSPGSYTYKAALFTSPCLGGTAQQRADCRQARTIFFRERVGFTAENMAAVEPRLTFFEKDVTTPLTINFEEYTALLTSAIQALEARLRVLEAR